MSNLSQIWKFVVAFIGAAAVTVIPVVKSSVDDGHIDQGEAVEIVGVALVAFTTAAGVYAKKNAVTDSQRLEVYNEINAAHREASLHEE